MLDSDMRVKIKEVTVVLSLRLRFATFFIPSIGIGFTSFFSTSVGVVCNAGPQLWLGSAFHRLRSRSRTER